MFPSSLEPSPPPMPTISLVPKMFWAASVACALLLSTLCWWWWTRGFNYWRVRGIPGPTPSPLYGNMKSIFTRFKAYSVEVDAIYQEYRNKAPLVGYFSGRQPYLMVMDMFTVQEVMIKNFNHFADNEPCDMITEASDPILINNPFFASGYKWKKIRQESVPGYTTNRIRTFFPIIRSISQRLNEFVGRRARESLELDADDISLRFTSDVSSDLGFGVDARALTDEGSAVLENGYDFVGQFQKIAKYFKWTSILPWWKRVYKYQMVEERTYKFFQQLVQNSLESRESGGTRVDFMNFLRQLKEKKQLTPNEVLSHAMMFYLDGHDTTAMAMSRILMELARNPRCQEKLRTEIAQATEVAGGELSYDDLIKLPYLEAVIFEALRLHSPIAFLARQCTKAFQLQHPDYAHPIEVPKGIPIIIPSASIHLDEAYFENPLQFDPERFIVNDAKKLIREGRLLFFGAGPRICIGMKFGLAQVKAGVCEIVQDFHLSEDEERMVKEPFPVTNFLNWPQKRILLNFRKI